jgi:hypothetical protein
MVLPRPQASPDEHTGGERMKKLDDGLGYQDAATEYTVVASIVYFDVSAALDL